MAKKGHGRIEPPSLLNDELVSMLSVAIENRNDFVLAWDIRPGEEPTLEAEEMVHIMTGNLITSCRLNGIRGRALAYEDEGARIGTFILRKSSGTREK